MSVWALLVYGLAVARLTRLVVADTITEGPREKVIALLTDAKALGPVRWMLIDLLDCVWCASMWVAGVMALLLYLFGPQTAWLLYPCIALAMSHLAGLIDDGASFTRRQRRRATAAATTERG